MSEGDGKMYMRTCSKEVSGFRCIMPTGHDGDCTSVPSLRVRDAWSVRRGDMPGEASAGELARVSNLLHQAQVVVDMESLLASVRSRRITELEAELDEVRADWAYLDPQCSRGSVTMESIRKARLDAEAKED